MLVIMWLFDIFKKRKLRRRLQLELTFSLAMSSISLIALYSTSNTIFLSNKEIDLNVGLNLIVLLTAFIFFIFYSYDRFNKLRNL